MSINLQFYLQCDGIKLSQKVSRYNELIQVGSIVFFQFAALGEMSAL